MMVRFERSNGELIKAYPDWQGEPMVGDHVTLSLSRAPQPHSRAFQPEMAVNFRIVRRRWVRVTRRTDEVNELYITVETL